MATFDLSPAELLDYRGRNPRPDDFADYWDRALAELDATDPAVELTRVAHPTPVAEAYDVFFTGVGGARVYAKHLRPTDGNTDGTSPGVVIFHGYSMRSPDWFDLIPYAAQGFSVLAMDCRGQGGRSTDVGVVPGNTLEGHIIRGVAGRPEDLLYRSIFLDTVQAVRVLAAQPEVDPTRIGATGASQGGGLSLACAALAPGQVKAAVAVYPFLSDYRRVWELDLAEDAYGEIQQYLRRFDPTHERIGEFFTRLGYIDVQHLAPMITAEVLMVTGLRDEICPPSTQYAAYNKIPGPKSVVHYPDFGHETLPGNNDRILAFLTDRL